MGVSSTASSFESVWVGSLGECDGGAHKRERPGDGPGSEKWADAVKASEHGDSFFQVAPAWDPS